MLTARPMPSFKVWDVVKVPFPYTDRPIRQCRPALVVAADELEQAHGLLWGLMITSAANRGWASAVEISDIKLAGLPAASLVRTAKIATIEASDAEPLGTLSRKDRLKVQKRLSEHLKPDQ